MQILNIAGYKFISLIDLDALQADFVELGKKLQLKGTIIISPEGININLAGKNENIQQFLSYLQSSNDFSDINFHQTSSNFQSFKKFKVKQKKEIITFKQPINPLIKRAPSITPELFKNWLDENRAITILDTRNNFEVQRGTFVGALNLFLKEFSEFPAYIEKIDRNKPVVMFCTGGIRCEKAALYLQQQGYSEVYQLDGGILGYFAKVGKAHYQGECFVFDERLALDTNLNPIASSND